MPQETPNETGKPPVRKESWLAYVVTIFVVIFVMGLLFAPLAKKEATPGRVVQTNNLANELNAACRAYMAEYGKPPSTSENYRLIKILTGDNPKKIVFLNLKPGDVTVNGDLIDSWETPYRITIDPDSKIHVISAGPDKIFDTPDDLTNQ